MKTTNKLPKRINEIKHRFILATSYDVLKDENVTTFSKVLAQYKNWVRQVNNHPPGYSDIAPIPNILLVTKYVIEAPKPVLQVKREVRTYVANTPKFHHWDRHITESSVVEFEDIPNFTPASHNSVFCSLCNQATDTIKATQGSLLRTGSRTFIDYERVDGEDIPVERKVKFPQYSACWICVGCLGDFTVLCNTLDSKFRRPKAKLKFNAPEPDKRQKLEKIEREHHTPDDAVVEYEPMSDCAVESVIHAYPARELNEAPAEKATRLKESKVTAKHKPSKHKKDYLGKHLE